jgi:hypothetical protein
MHSKANLLISTLIVVVGFGTFRTSASAETSPYLPYKALSQTLTELADQHPDIVQLESLVRCADQRDVWLLTLGQGEKQNRNQRPAILVVAGIEGDDLIGSAIALAWLKQLTGGYDSNGVITQLLKTTTVYVIPRIHPEAAERYFDECLLERPTSNCPVDDDHDGLKDEAGPEDLNGDGTITWMRIADPEGNYLLDSREPRLLVKADHLKAQAGAWRYLTEGLDNDQDELWNEDGTGGVNFNRNFPYNYRFFSSGAGVHQISEIETKALADFVIAHPQIGVVVTYGAADNLLKTPKASEPKPRKPMTDLDQEDVGYYQALGKTYRKALGLEKELSDSAKVGSFSDWMYFHRGRLSLAICPWSPDMAMALFKEDPSKKTTPADCNAAPADANTPPTKNDSKKKEDNEDQEKARKQLAWFDQHAPEAFVPWTSFDHPDFPDQTVEIGGYRPFTLSHPPDKLVDDITGKQALFLTEVAQTLPRIGIRKVTVHHLGQSVFDIDIEIENTGFLPTALSHGQRSREVFPTRLVLDIPKTALLSGEQTTRLNPIQGSGGVAKTRFVLHCANQDRINFKVVSMLAGQVEGHVHLHTDSSHLPSQENSHEN